MNRTIVEIRSVSAGYGEDVILKDINLDIHEHDFLGVIGPNGGGKTTLLKVMMGLLKPFRGSVKTFGNGEQNIFGYLPQVNQVDKKFPISVMDVVASGLMQKQGVFTFTGRVEKERIENLLELAGITHLRTKRMGDLSGGQMQRVFLARAIISGPLLLVLDEPDTFVDTNFEKDLYEILEELNKQMAILIVSHDLGMISAQVKTIACVNRGLDYHPSSDITEEILASYNCPIELIAHGDLPHRILKDHPH